MLYSNCRIRLYLLSESLSQIDKILTHFKTHNTVWLSRIISNTKISSKIQLAKWIPLACMHMTTHFPRSGTDTSIMSFVYYYMSINYLL